MPHRTCQRYQAFEEAGNSSLGMDELNQTVTFTAVALSVSSNRGEPLIEAGDDQGNVLARLTSDDEQQVASWARWKKARPSPPAALQFSSGTDYLSFGDCHQ